MKPASILGGALGAVSAVPTIESILEAMRMSSSEVVLPWGALVDCREHEDR